MIIENPEPPTALQGLTQSIGILGNQYVQSKVRKQQQRDELMMQLALIKAKTDAEMNSPLGKLDYETKLSTLNKNRYDLGQPIVGQQQETSPTSGLNFNRVLTSPNNIQAPVKPVFSAPTSVPSSGTGMIQEGATFENTPYGGMRQKGATFMNPEAEKQKEILKGISGDVAGRVTLAKESIKDIEDVINILFPDGTPESFKRGIATGSNIPGSNLPFIGRVIPKQSPIRTESMQDVFRKSGKAISGRVLIKTGVAARPEEVAAEREQFLAGLTSNPESTLKGFRELQDFYRSFLMEADPKVRFGAEQLPNFGKPQSKNISLPPTIKTTSQALQYLTSQGMSKEQAIQWLRSQ